VIPALVLFLLCFSPHPVLGSPTGLYPVGFEGRINYISEAVRQHILSLVAVSRRPVLNGGANLASKRRQLTTGAASVEPEYTYTTVATAIQALYEGDGDWERCVPMVDRRKGWRTGRSDSFRLRAVQKFALESGGGVMSLEGLEKLWDLLDTWDGTKPGMAVDERHKDTLRDKFNTVNAFKDAVHDDADDAVLGAGLLRCPLLVDGQMYVTSFRPVLEVLLDMLKRG